MFVMIETDHKCHGYRMCCGGRSYLPSAVLTPMKAEVLLFFLQSVLWEGSRMYDLSSQYTDFGRRYAVMADTFAGLYDINI